MNERKELRRIATALEHASASPRPARDTSRPAAKDQTPWKARIIRAVMVSEKGSRIATAHRRTLPIMGYVGPNGGGKSLAMVKDTLPSLQRGRRVLSTVALLDAETGQPHPAYERFYDFDQLLEAQDCDVLMDEVVGIASARESARLSVRVQNILVQLRRRNVVLRWSAPNWLRADRIIREVTQSVTECRGFYADKRGARAASGELALWAPKRLFQFRTFDTTEFEEWTAGKRERLTPARKEWFWGPDSVAFRSYDTLDAVSQVAHASESGVCEVCEGTVRRHQCRCERRADGRLVHEAQADTRTGEVAFA